MAQLLTDFARKATSQYNKGAEDLTQRIQIEEIVGAVESGAQRPGFRAVW